MIWPEAVSSVIAWPHALQRNEQLTEELRQAKGQIRTLQDKLFGRKSEKPARADRSNDLFDPVEFSVPSRKRGAQPGHAGHGRRDYSHLPVEEESVPLPAEFQEQDVWLRQAVETGGAQEDVPGRGFPSVEMEGADEASPG